MRPTFRLGTVAGVPVGVHWTLLVIGGLLVLSLATASLPSVHPGYAPAAYWLVALTGAVLFFGSVLVHEISHALVAHRHGLKVHGITLWLLGGEARLGGEPPTPRAELAIAAVGPLTSFGLAGAFAVAALGASALGLAGPTQTVLAWLALVNGVLAVFNMLPGAPLDGGRVLAALLWWWRKDRAAGALSAARAGRVTGSLLIALGVGFALLGGPAGLWTALVGWFIFGAAGAEATFWRQRRAIAGRTVGSVMSAHLPRLPDWTPVADVAARLGDDAPVALLEGPDGRARGAVVREAIAAVPPERRPWLGAQSIAVPLVGLPTARHDELVEDVLTRAVESEEDVTLVVVVDGERVMGLLTPDDLRRAVGGPRQSSVSA